MTRTSQHSGRYQSLPTDDADPTPAVQEPSEDFQYSSAQSLDNGGTKRSLQERHLSMIALAGMIGTGLFLSSGKALAQAGPLGCVSGFMIMGTVTASIAYISAEMSSFQPVGGGFVRHANMWLDKSTGIAIGWNFWYSMAITMPTEISAATTLLSFWKPDINQFIPISILWVVIMVVNFSPVRVYGEFEFYLAFCKIALIVCFIIAGIILDLGGFPGQDKIGFRYWQDPYPLFHEYIATGFKGRFLGFWSAMISAAFAYGNVQVVAMAGAETRNPRKAIPAALKKTFARVVVFYVASIFVISLTVPANDERLYHPTGDVMHSPFIIAFSRAGLKALPSVINAIVFSSAFSSGNSCSFLASRTLHGLALDGHAPSIFLELNRFGVPYVAVAASVIWGVIAYASLNHGAFQAFLWLVSLVTTSGIISWVIICLTYLRFFYALQVQKIPRRSLPYRSPLQPYITYYALIMNILILGLSGWDSFLPEFSLPRFTSNYFNCLFYPALYLACKSRFRDSMIPLQEIDFYAELTAIGLEEESENCDDITKFSAYDRTLNALF
ncbi:amino acid permease/ SLC12A domain-containing protein [Flammula alnicola]|nr:amino acid permease/ SLC12A domain-containing protein [Flammula alnicola]